MKYWSQFNKYNQVNQVFDWWLRVQKKAFEDSFHLDFILNLHFPPVFKWVQELCYINV